LQEITEHRRGSALRSTIHPVLNFKSVTKAECWRFIRAVGAAPANGLKCQLSRNAGKRVHSLKNNQKKSAKAQMW
jgi:hypothetical protein